MRDRIAETIIALLIFPLCLLVLHRWMRRERAIMRPPTDYELTEDERDELAEHVNEMLHGRYAKRRKLLTNGKQKAR